MLENINENNYSSNNNNNKINLRNYYFENTNDINILKEELLELKFENSKLKEKENSTENLRKKLRDANNKINYLETKIEKIIKDHNNEKIKNNTKMRNILLEKDFQELTFNKRSIIYDQKLNKVRDLEMENEVYRDELSALKDKNKKLEESVNIKKKELVLENKMKFNKIKNKVLKDLMDAKKNILTLNSEKKDINANIIILQNKKLLEQIEFQKKEIDKFTKENKELKLKIINLEKGIEINEKVKMKLASKLIYKNNKSINLFNKSNLFSKYKKRALTINNKNSITDNNKNDETFMKSYILNTTSTNMEQYNNNILNAEKLNKDIIHKINIDSILNNDSNNNYPSSNCTISKIENDKINLLNSEKKHNSNDYQDTLNKEYNLKNNSVEHKKSISINREQNFIKEFITKSDKILNFHTQNNYYAHRNKNQIIDEKNNEISILKAKIDNLKNKLNFYGNRYKKIYDFLEECLNDFFLDIKEKGKNFSLNIEEIKKCNFENFNREDKYSLLVLLMNKLLPFVINNFNSNFNLGDTIFKTNINIHDRNFNKKINYINDNTLRKAFLRKNNKLQKELFIKNNTFSNGSIPVLRNKNISPDHRINEDKYRLLVD